MSIPIKEYLRLLATYLRPQKSSVLLLVLSIFTSIALQLVNPQIIRHFIDSAQAGASMDILFKTGLTFLGLAVIQQAVSVFSRYRSEVIAWRATNDLRFDLTNHCLRLDLSFHNSHTPGEMIERLDGDVTTLSNFFSQFIIQFVGNGLLLAGILVMMYREDWRIGLALSLFTGIALFVMARFRDIAVPHWTAERQASAELYGFLEEHLAGTEDIRASGAEAYVLRQFFIAMRNLMRRSLKAALMVNILLNILFLIFAAGTATAFAIGAYLFQGEAVTIGTVYIIFHYTRMLEWPIDNITHQIQDLQKAGAGITRIRELFSIQSKVQPLLPAMEEQPEPTSQQAIGMFFSEPLLEAGRSGGIGIAFEKVTFGYDDNKPSENLPEKANHNQEAPSAVQPDINQVVKEFVLTNLTFDISPRRVVGLLGRTGSGKTTLSRLLFRLFDPDQGKILFSNGGDGLKGINIRHIPLHILRQKVGMVTQNIQLFNASIRDNLTFFDHTISDQRIQEVVQELELGKWLGSMPSGLDTVLDSGGGGLSAGEAQLLAFMRIFLKDPSMVVLDEASSRLDPVTEAFIERAVDRLVKNRTAIIIAHRLGTIQRADDIMILENGRLLEYGERRQLAVDPDSHFYHLLQTGMEEVLV